MLLWLLESNEIFVVMEMDFIDNVRDIHSFVKLQEIIESWVNEGVIEEKTLELELGYSSLIAYPSIYLTSDSAEREIKAAKRCYELMMKYAKNSIEARLSSGDDKTQIATSLLVLPPEKSILTVCGEFFELNYFLKGLYPNFTEQQLANINGDDYAKVWLNIFSKGYRFQLKDQVINSDFNHLNETLIIISKMQLSSPYKEKMNLENIRPQFKKYYRSSIDGNGSNGSSGTGCMIAIFIFMLTSIMLACSM